MSDLTDLELCRRIADIENIHYMETRYKGNANFIALVSKNDFTGTPPEMIGKYNPLTDDALCFRLMVKYKVQIDYDDKTASIYKDGDCRFIATATATYDSNINRGILLAIVEAHKS